MTEGWTTPLQRVARLSAYTPNGQVDWVEDGLGNRSDYAYDGLDRISVLSFPMPTVGAHAANPADYEQYGYDVADNPTSKRVRSGETFTTTFDALDRITYVDAPSGTNDTSFTYDLLGRRLTATQPGVQTLTSTWDALGRETSQAGALGTMAYQYDLAGRRTRMTWSVGGQVNYVWDLDGLMRTMTWSPLAYPITAYSYDDLGRRTGIMRGNGVTTAYGWNTASQLTSLGHDLAGTAYDVSYEFSYSPAGQVMNRSVSNSVYDYAPVDGTTAYANNGLNQTTSAGGLGVTWDARGNLTSDGVRSYGYDAANRMLSGGGATLAYDPLDRLYAMTGAGAGRFQYDGSQLAAVYDASGNLLGRWFAGPNPDEWALYEDYPSNRWPLQDTQGSVVAITDDSGNAIAINAYDEYGQPRAGNAGRMQYTGQMWLPDAGLDHYKARGYHAGLGRFLQTDPVGYEQGLNLYAYVQNDPVNLIDPFGLMGQDHDATELDEIVVTGQRRRRQPDPCGLVCRLERLIPQRRPEPRLPQFDTSSLYRNQCPAVDDLLNENLTVNRAGIDAMARQIRTNEEQAFWASVSPDGRTYINVLPAERTRGGQSQAGTPPAGNWSAQIFVHVHTWNTGPTAADSQNARRYAIATILPSGTVFYGCPN